MTGDDGYFGERVAATYDESSEHVSVWEKRAD
jgi:hypothetical protein